MDNTTLLIGVDGGDFRTLDPLLKEGNLPNIAEVIDSGFRGRLSSSMPPWTPTAWTSLSTGKNPGKHGIFDFKMPGEDGLVDATDIKTNAIWDYLSHYNEPSIVVNVPVTHPARAIEGVLVPGYLGPEINEATAHPPNILDKIRSEVGEYRIYVEDASKDADTLCEEYLDLMQMRVDAMTYLTSEYNWSFGMVQFQRTDTVFHELPEEEHIRSVYSKLDDCVGQLLDEIDPANVLIVSDHGMGESGDWDFNINSWLREEGYLETSTEGFRPGWKLNGSDSPSANDWKLSLLESTMEYAAQLGFTPQELHKMFKKLGIAEPFISRISTPWLNKILMKKGDGIDRNNSRAYCPSGQGLSIICEDGLRDELIERLESLTDPDGISVFDRVKPREEVYNGNRIAFAPDILFLPSGMRYYISGSFKGETFGYSRYQYNHKTEGIIIGYGSDILTLKSEQTVSIEDIAPTVLTLCELPLDADFDGKSALNLIEKEETGSKKYERIDQGVSSQDQYQDVESRLQDLGYME